MTDLSAIDYKESVRRVVRRRLKELGIKVPKSKPRQDKVQVRRPSYLLVVDP